MGEKFQKACELFHGATVILAILARTKAQAIMKYRTRVQNITRVDAYGGKYDLTTSVSSITANSIALTHET